MICLHFMHGIAYVWDAEDWIQIRRHRIMGNFVGSLANQPTQENCCGLPLALLKEETALLLEKKLAVLLDVSQELISPTNDLLDRYLVHSKRARDEQVQHMKNCRIKEIEDTLDLIIEGKRAKLEGRPLKKKHLRKLKSSKIVEDKCSSGSSNLDVQIDRERVFQSEVQKIQPPDEKYIGIQIFSADPWLKNPPEVGSFNYPVTENEILQYQTYKDLWQKGFYITKGIKFGANYLVYPGDPSKYHAHYIVICLENNIRKLSPLEIVAYGRLGQSVRKTVVLSYFDRHKNLCYQSIQWSGI